MKFSFVIPCYRSEKTISIVVDEIKCEMKKRADDTYEIILVNDHSPDNVWATIESLARENENILGINLARNFGQHCALMAGYAQCSGDYVVSLDDDGQAPLDSLCEMIAKAEEGYDVVFAYYHEIKQNLFRRFGSWMACRMSEIMLNPPKDFKGSSFYVARRFVICEMLRYTNSYPYLAGLIFRTTKNIAWIETQHRSRLEGTSGYSFARLFALWMNGFTAFSIKPLQFSTFLGVFFAVVGFVYALVIIVQKCLGIIGVAGWSSIIALMLIIGGCVLMMLGLIGEYVGRIYICINNSPQYVIKETTKKN